MKKAALPLLLFFLQSLLFTAVAQPWIKHSGFPSGAKISDIESDNAGRVFVLTDEGEVYYSSNAGAQWNPVEGVFSFYNTLDIEVDEVSGTLYVGTTGSGITWSDDLGATWNTEYIYTNPVSGFHAMFTKIGVKHGTGVVVGSEPSFNNSPMYTTLNGGATWITQPLAPFAGALDFLFLPNGELLAACEKGVYTSSDNGASWSPLNTGIANMQTRSIARKSASGKLFAATDLNVLTADTAGGGIYVSTDNGLTWTLSSNGIANRATNEVLVDDATGAVYALSPDGVYKSNDDGASWQAVNTNLFYKEFSSADKLSNGEIVIGSTKDGVAFSAEPTLGWTYRNEGLANKSFASMVINHQHIFLLSQEGGTIYRKAINATNWEQPGNIQLPNVTAGSFLRNDSTGNLYAVFDGWDTTVHVMRSADNGDTWSDITSSIGLPAGATSLQFMDLKIGPDDVLYLIVNYEGLMTTTMDLFKSTNDGVTWTSILTVPSTDLISLSELDIAPNGDLYVKAFTNSFTNAVLISTNQGTSFAPFQIPYVTFGTFYDFVIDNNNSVLLSFNNEIQRRVGTAWELLSNGGWSTDFNMNPIRLYVDNANNYYITSLDDGIFTSDDEGSSWSNVTAGLPQYNTPFGPIRLSLTSLDFDSLNNPFAFTIDDDVEAAPFRGIYTRGLTTGLSIATNNVFDSMEIFPNPSSNFVYIQLPKESGEIRIVNTLGQLVFAQPVSGNATIDVSQLPSGMYHVQFDGSNRHTTKFVKQ